MSSREHARRFHFLREIASGGFGTVHLVKVMHADGFSRLVAVKLLKTQWSDTDEIARRMRDEARLLGLLRHRNIVDVIDLTSIDGRAAVVMEYLEAVDLRGLTERLSKQGKRMPVRAALEIAAACAGALDAAYNRPPMPGEKPLRVIHRDIKPSNVMLDESGLVKVLDFGVARSEIENRESHTQELQFGSVDYMAPERLFFEPETPASDVYSLAATLYEVLAQDKLGKARGRPERHQASLQARVGALRQRLDLSPQVGGELESLLLAALAFNHEERPTAAEFYQRARVLSRLATDDELSAWAERVLPPIVSAVSESRRHPSPLDDTVLLEDSKAFTPADPTEEVSGASRPTAEELRRGALAELEESADRAVSAPPTGAPPTGAPSGGPRPAPVDEWDDGPTHISMITDLPELGRPLDTEEVIGLSARDAAAADLPPDPADPFATLSEVSSSRSEPVSIVPLRDSPVPLPLAPGPSPRGRRPATRRAPAGPAAGGLAPHDEATVRAAVGDDTEAPTVVMTAESGSAVHMIAGLGPLGDHPSSLPDEDSATLDTPRGPAQGPPPPGATQSVTQVAGVREPESARNEVMVASVELEPDPPSDASERPPRGGGPRIGIAVAAGCLLGLGLLGVAGGVAWWKVDQIQAALAGVAVEAAPTPATPERAAEAADAADAADAAAPAEADPSESLVFTSEEPGTAKLKVRCDTGSGRGTAEATVAVAAAQQCTVTAMKADRSRLTAVVDAPRAGLYRCFVAGASTCERR